MFLINTVLWYGLWFLNVHASHKALKPPRRARKLVPGRNNTDRKREIRLVLEGWIVWTVFIFAEGITDRTLYYLLPFYSEFKSALLVYLILSRTIGTHAIYINLVLPTIHQFCHPFELFFSLVYVLTEALISLVPPALPSVLRRCLGWNSSSAPLDERLSIAEGKSEAQRIVSEIHEMQKMVRPLSTQGSQHDGQTRVVGVRKRKGGLTLPTRPSITIPRNIQPAQEHMPLKPALISTKAPIQKPAKSTTPAPSTPKFVPETKRSTSKPRLSPATSENPARYQTPLTYPTALLKISPESAVQNVLPNVNASKDNSSVFPSSSLSRSLLSFRASSVHGRRRARFFRPGHPNPFLSLNSRTALSPPTLPAFTDEPTSAQRVLRQTPARKAKLNRVETEFLHIPPLPSLSLASNSEVHPSKRRKTTKIVQDNEPRPRRELIEVTENEKAEEEYVDEEGSDKKLSIKRKREGVSRNKSKVLEPVTSKDEEMEVELSLEDRDIERHLPLFRSATRPATRQRSASTASGEKSTRLAPYSRRNVPTSSVSAKVVTVSRRAAPTTTLPSSQPIASIRNSVASRNKLIKTDNPSSLTTQPSAPTKLPVTSVSSTPTIRKDTSALSVRSSTRSKTTVKTSNADSEILPSNPSLSSKISTSRSNRYDSNKLGIAPARSIASRRTAGSTDAEAPAKTRVRKANGRD